MKKQGKINKLTGPKGLLTAFFLTIHILCGFHALAHSHDEGHAQEQQIECDVCHVANAPIISASVTTTALTPPLGDIYIALPTNPLEETSWFSPDRARAPPIV